MNQKADRRGETPKRKVPLELYIHIPFCIRKCLYCDFLSFSAAQETIDHYVEILIEEIRAMGRLYGTCSLEPAVSHSSFEVISVFLGGGTPSILKAEQTACIMAAVKDCFKLSEDAEVTTEANPGTLDAEKLEAYKACGINRLSIGLQSAEDEELVRLGRIHTFQMFLDGFHLARKAGFDNISIDLMSALPGQTKASFEKTLRAVTALSPEHLSAYSLIIEEGTPFYEWYGGESKGREPSDTVVLPLPDEESDREIYHFTKEYLKAAGYERYEISNYSKPGRECRHNIGYWVGTQYLGLGLGASSYLEGERFFNERELEKYLTLGSQDFVKRSHHKERERLTQKDRMEEFMFLGLRLAEGVGAGEFEGRFGVSIETIYGTVLEQLLEEGLMVRGEAQERMREDSESWKSGLEVYWRLTEYGTDVSNYVLSKFLL